MARVYAYWEIKVRKNPHFVVQGVVWGPNYGTIYVHEGISLATELQFKD